MHKSTINKFLNNLNPFSKKISNDDSRLTPINKSSLKSLSKKDSIGFFSNKDDKKEIEVKVEETEFEEDLREYRNSIELTKKRLENRKIEGSDKNELKKEIGFKDMNQYHGPNSGAFLENKLSKKITTLKKLDGEKKDCEVL